MASSPAPWGVGATVAWSLAAFIFAVIAAMIVSAGWWVFGGAGPDEWIHYQRENEVAKVFREMVFNCGMAGVVILAAHLSRISVRDYLALVPPRGSLAEVIVLSAAALAACGISLYGLAFALGFEFGFSSSELTVAALLGWFQKAIFGPVSEELLFRGFMYRGLAASRFGTWGAIAVTTVLFAVIHLTGVSGEALWFHYVFVTVMGVTLGWLRARTGAVPADCRSFNLEWLAGNRASGIFSLETQPSMGSSPKETVARRCHVDVVTAAVFSPRHE